jgi:hypothetical protein
MAQYVGQAVAVDIPGGEKVEVEHRMRAENRGADCLTSDEDADAVRSENRNVPNAIASEVSREQRPWHRLERVRCLEVADLVGNH